MKLSLKNRVKLAQRLISTLDDEGQVDAERLRIGDAERRLTEMRKGKVQGVDAAIAFKKAREALTR